MEGETLQKFYTQLVLMPKVLHYAQYVLLALGCVLLLVPVVYRIRTQVSGGWSEVRTKQLTACLLGEGGLDGIPLLSFPAVPADALSLEPTLGSVRGLCGGGEAVPRPCVSCMLLCLLWEAWGPSPGGAAGGFVMRPGA